MAAPKRMRTVPSRAAVSVPPAEHKPLREHTPMLMKRTRAAGENTFSRPLEQARAGNQAGGSARSASAAQTQAAAAAAAAAEAAVADAEAATATAAEADAAVAESQAAVAGQTIACYRAAVEYRRQQMHRVVVDDERVVRHDHRT